MINPGSQNMMIAPVVKLLLILNIGIFLLQLVAFERMLVSLALWPLDLSGLAQAYNQPTFHLHQLLTYGFLHGDLTHLLSGQQWPIVSQKAGRGKLTWFTR